eukprot:IDg7176t1
MDGCPSLRQLMISSSTRERANGRFSLKEITWKKEQRDELKRVQKEKRERVQSTNQRKSQDGEVLIDKAIKRRVSSEDEVVEIEDEEDITRRKKCRASSYNRKCTGDIDWLSDALAVSNADRLKLDRRRPLMEESLLAMEREE